MWTQNGGVMFRVRGTRNQWQLDPFGAVEVLKDLRKGLTVRLLDWDDKKAFLPRKQPEFIFFLSTEELRYVQEDAMRRRLAKISRFFN